MEWLLESATPLDWIARGIAAVAAVGLCTALVALVLSLPATAWSGATVLLRREWIPLSYNLRSLRRRKVTTWATLGGLTLVVFVLCAVLMFAAGITHTLESAGGARQAKILLANRPGESLSFVPPPLLNVIATSPQIAQRPDGTPLMSAEMVTMIWAGLAGTDDPDRGSNLTIRGFQEDPRELHPPLHLEGRMFQAGTDELVVGGALAGRYAGAHVGGTMRFAGKEFSVVGVLDYGGSAFDSEVWGSFETLGPGLRHGLSTVTAALKETASLQELNEWLAESEELKNYEAVWEADFWRSRSGNFVDLALMVGLVVSVIFSFGAVLGAMNTMYAQVSARTREIGTLRAIGFKPRAILLSLVVESLVLALLAGAAGVALAALLQNAEFHLTSTQTLTEITYGFHLQPLIVAVALGFALVMGYAGGLLPALRAARMPISLAVRTD